MIQNANPVPTSDWELEQFLSFRPAYQSLKQLPAKEKLGISLHLTGLLFSSRHHRRFTTRAIQERVKIIFESVSLPAYLSVHSLRHTYCSLLLASGKVGLGFIRDNLGHHSISVTNLYSRAVGNLGDVELYSMPSSEKRGKCESQPHGQTKKN